MWSKNETQEGYSMKLSKIVILLFIILLCGSQTIVAASDFMKDFKSKYKLVDLDLLRHPVEEFVVSDFTYKKDIANFHFKEGKMYFLRYINERPTTAIFIGSGSASIDIPSHGEGQLLKSISGRADVREDFEICFIRMADDFDLAVKEKFSSVTKELKWKDFTQAKEAQGEFFFKPNINHFYDNYFQLLHSIYERSEDGYFWIDFNRYNYLFDPNRPQPVNVGYEFEINDMLITEAVTLNSGIQTDILNTDLSSVIYPTTAISHYADIEMGGLDGSRLEHAKADLQIVINSDSLKFVNTFLHYNLKLDSLYYNDNPVDYYRRKDFKFIGIILPEYHYKGDTLTFTYWYKGKNFDYVLPYVENRTPSKHTFTFTIPKGYNYIMQGMSEQTDAGRGKVSFDVELMNPYREFYFQGLAANYDTLTIVSDMGVPINFLKSRAFTKKIDCFVPDEIFETSVMNAFNFMASKVGAPIGTFGISVFPERFISMPGMVQVPQILCYDRGYTEPLGGFDIFSGHSMAKQWFGHLLKPQSGREVWLETSASEYLSLLNIGNQNSNAYYSNLVLSKDSLLKIEQLNRIRPLYSSDRNGDLIATNKGVWVFHMLRYMMLDLESGNNPNFNKFFHRLCLRANGKSFTNSDIIELAEKYYGDDLDWFFNQWLFGVEQPEYRVEYSIEKSSSGYYIDIDVLTMNVSENFKMPVIFNVTDINGGSNLVRKMVTGNECSVKLGPYEIEPSGLVFNELFSVLCKETTNKR